MQGITMGQGGHRAGQRGFEWYQGSIRVVQEYTDGMEEGQDKTELDGI